MSKSDQNKLNQDKRGDMQFGAPSDSEMQHAWDNVDNYKDQYPKPNLDKMWKGTKQKLGWENEPKVIPFRKKLLRYAAAIAIPLLIIGTVVYFSIEKIISNEGLISYTSPEGIRSKYSLPDGSTVWLQPKSEIKYPKEFNAEKREVYFSGQAYFDVQHNADCPFVINVQKMKITVLGTQFYVKAIESHDIIETGLISGKVKLTGGKFEKTMRPEDIVIVSKNANNIVDTRTLSSNSFKWENSSLVFNNCSFGTLVKDISEWYGVEYYIDPKIDANKKITLTIRDESFEQIAEILKIVVPFEYKISDNRIVFTLGK